MASCLSMLKTLTLVILLLALAIPFYYRSTNWKYLQIRLIHSIFTFEHRLVPDRERPELSAEYRAFESFFHRFPATNYDPTADYLEVAKQMRENFKFGTIIPRPKDCRFRNQIYEYQGQTAEVFWVDHRDRVKDWTSDRILIYFHGGGYILGDFSSYSGYECYLSRLFNVTVIHLEYRRVPEHPLPAAVDDAIILYQALLQDGLSPSQLIIMGDSAGGGLTLLTLQRLLRQQLPQPRAAITISPWADLSSSTPSYARNQFKDVMLRLEHIPWVIERVLGPNHTQIVRNDPVYSPFFGSFKGFPPLLVTVGTAEVLEDEGREVAEKAKKEGVDVTLLVGEHLMHVYPLFFDYFPEAVDAMMSIRQWLDQKFQV